MSRNIESVQYSSSFDLSNFRHILQYENTYTLGLNDMVDQTDMYLTSINSYRRVACILDTR